MSAIDRLDQSTAIFTPLFPEDEVTQEIPVETMHELVSSERPTRNIRPLRRPRHESPTEYSLVRPTGSQEAQ